MVFNCVERDITLHLSLRLLVICIKHPTGFTKGTKSLIFLLCVVFIFRDDIVFHEHVPLLKLSISNVSLNIFSNTPRDLA